MDNGIWQYVKTQSVFPDVDAEILFLLCNKCFNLPISQAELYDLF